MTSNPGPGEADEAVLIAHPGIVRATADEHRLAQMALLQSSRVACASAQDRRRPHHPIIDKEMIMAKSQRKGSKEARKPKKAQPPKTNASQPSVKNMLPDLLKN